MYNSFVPGIEGQTEGTEESLACFVQTFEGGSGTSKAGGHPAGKYQHLSRLCDSHEEPLRSRPDLH